MEAKEKFEVGKDVYIIRLDRNENELYFITAKVVDVTYGDETMYVCRAYADSILYNVSEKDVFATHQEAEECCKKIHNSKNQNKNAKS